MLSTFGTKLSSATSPAMRAAAGKILPRMPSWMALAALEFIPTRRSTPESMAASIDAAGITMVTNRRTGPARSIRRPRWSTTLSPAPPAAPPGPGEPHAPSASAPAPAPSPRSSDRRDTPPVRLAACRRRARLAEVPVSRSAGRSAGRSASARPPARGSWRGMGFPPPRAEHHSVR
jgi:hypothetical protein